MSKALARRNPPTAGRLRKALAPAIADRFWPLVLLILLPILPLLVLPAGAAAHAYIVKSEPAVNAALQAAPTAVRIEFSEPIQAAFDALSVLDAHGQRVDQGDAHLDPADSHRLTASLQPNLDRGVYSIHWRVISADGHPIEGVIPFSVGAATGDATAATDVTKARNATEAIATAAQNGGYGPGADVLLIRSLWYLSLLSLLGLIAGRFWVFPQDKFDHPVVWRRFRRALSTASGGLALAVLLGMPLHVTIDAGVGWSRALSSDLMHTVLAETRFGAIWVWQLVLTGAMIGVVSLLVRPQSLGRTTVAVRWSPVLAGGLGLGLLVSRSLGGHAAVGAEPGATVAADVLHMSAAAVWLGGLLALALMAGQIRGYRTLLRSFTPWALGSVIVLAGTGLYAALRQIPTLYALQHTGYGRMLLLKLALFGVMLALGFWHYRSGRRRADRRPVRRTLTAEFGVGVLVLGVTALLTNLPSGLATPGPIVATRAFAAGGSATLRITPNLAGDNAFSVALTAPDGGPRTDVQQVTLTFTPAAAGGGPETDAAETVRLSMDDDGRYHAQGLYLSAAGRWLVRVHVLTADFNDEDVVFPILTGAPQG